MFYWTYLWTEASGWTRLRRDAPSEHHRGELALPRCLDGRVRFATILGETKDRRAVKVLLVDFPVHDSNARGYMTPRQRKAHTDAVGELWEAHGEAVLSGPPGNYVSAPPANGIAAASNFARRRYDAKYRWHPAPSVLSDLCRRVNSRAGREVFSPR